VAAIWILAVALPCSAAELVAIRVGEHPAFTRVVFELDVPGGYRIERNADGESPNVIRVTLDAASSDQRITSGSSGIESVSVDAGSPRSVARIAARDPGRPIKEMILADPPRVVLDFMRPEPVTPPRVARAAPQPEPTAQPQPAPTEPSIPAAAPAVVPEPEAAPPQTAEIEPIDSTRAEAPAPPDALHEPDVVATATEPEAVAEPESEAGLEAEAVEAEAAPAADVARTPTPVDPDFAPVPRSSPSMGLVAAGLGLIALLVGGFLFLRRRRSGDDADMDVSTLFPEADGDTDDRPIPKEGFSMGAASPAASDPGPSSEPAADAGLEAPTPVRTPDSPAAAHGIFDEELEEKEAMAMDHNETLGSMDSEAPTQLGAGANLADGGGSNIVRIIQDMESRIAHLEARLDESIEARQQLERQVSAQTEELRVQRAAIARTQRALRSMNRTDEEQATEPALRNPDAAPRSE